MTDPDELRRWWGDTKLELAEGGLFQLRWRNTDEDGNVATLDGGEVDLAHPADLFAPLQQAYTEKYGPGPEPS